MKHHIVCLGDSNTHGYCADPEDCADGTLQRFNEWERWTCLLQQGLGQAYLILEEGLSGRTTVFPDPVEEGLAAVDYVYPCLRSHLPVSLLVIMLGTNDTKERFGANGCTIGLGMERLIRKAQSVDCWVDGKPNILIVVPPCIGGGSENPVLYGDMGPDCVVKSQELPQRYRLIAERTGVHYLDANTVGAEFNQIDFMHLTRKGHRALADALIKLIPTLL